jgi:hypothetical protein
MRRDVPMLGLLVLVVVAGQVACAGPNESAPPAASGEGSAPAATLAESAPAEVPGQDREVPYESTTHGALQVMSVRDDPTDWFDVFQGGERAFDGNPRLLGSTLELLPGTYDVDVNRTRRQVTIAAGRRTIVWTGELRVEGEPSGAYWYPMQGSEQMLSSNPSTLGSSRDFFPGTYTVFVHVSVGVPDANLGEAEVRAGQTTLLRH